MDAKDPDVKSGRWMPQLLFLLLCSWLVACQPTLIQAEQPVRAASNISYQGVSLTYDASLADSVLPVTLAPTENGGPFGWPTPLTVRLTFAGKRQEGVDLSFGDAVAALSVYRTDEFIAIDPHLDQIGQRVRALQTLLATRPHEIDNEIPVLPLLHSGQQFRSQIAFMEFQNGSGVRFLTQYGQEPRPLNNQELLYVFQGLTADGQYYVSAFFPIRTSHLPATAAMSESEYAAFIADWESQIAQAALALEELPGDEFEPSLSLLDEMLQSLKVQPF